MSGRGEKEQERQRTEVAIEWQTEGPTPRGPVGKGKLIKNLQLAFTGIVVHEAPGGQSMQVPLSSRYVPAGQNAMQVPSLPA